MDASKRRTFLEVYVGGETEPRSLQLEPDVKFHNVLRTMGEGLVTLYWGKFPLHPHESPRAVGMPCGIDNIVELVADISRYDDVSAYKSTWLGGGEHTRANSFSQSQSPYVTSPFPTSLVGHSHLSGTPRRSGGACWAYRPNTPPARVPRATESSVLATASLSAVERVRGPTPLKSRTPSKGYRRRAIREPHHHDAAAHEFKYEPHNGNVAKPHRTAPPQRTLRLPEQPSSSSQRDHFHHYSQMHGKKPMTGALITRPTTQSSGDGCGEWLQPSALKFLEEEIHQIHLCLQEQFKHRYTLEEKVGRLAQQLHMMHAPSVVESRQSRPSVNCRETILLTTPIPSPSLECSIEEQAAKIHHNQMQRLHLMRQRGTNGSSACIASTPYASSYN